MQRLVLEKNFSLLSKILNFPVTPLNINDEHERSLKDFESVQKIRSQMTMKKVESHLEFGELQHKYMKRHIRNPLSDSYYLTLGKANGFEEVE